MHPDLLLLQQAADGLLFMSESDFPFEVVQLGPLTEGVGEKLKELSGKNEIEKVSLTYFLRNAVRTDPGAGEEQILKANRFIQLQNILEQKLTDVAVYRLGTTQVAIFIIGVLSDGSFGGLKTTSIET